MASWTVSLLHSWAPLLSGSLWHCAYDPYDPSCVGGVASVSAYIRHLIPKDEPHFVVPLLDRRTAFVQMHPRGWNVNKDVLHDLIGWDCFAAPPSLLTVDTDDLGASNSDLSMLQSQDFPFLLTNVAVPPANSWHYYTEAVHFDLATGLAVMSVADSDQTFNVPHIESALGVLDYLAKVNEESGACNYGSTQGGVDSDVFGEGEISNRHVPSLARCWVPVIYYADTHPDLFHKFVAITSEHRHPPALIIDVENNDGDTYRQPTRVGSGRVWVVSYQTGTRGYYQHQIDLGYGSTSFGRPHPVNVTLIARDMKYMPEEYRDDIWFSQIERLRALAIEADSNDPIVGHTAHSMPVARSTEGNYRRCQAGECEIGNLFADALRWRADANVAFITSGGLRGGGWNAGPVKMSFLWESLPFPNTMCTGVMNGVSLFRLVNYTVGVATFQSTDSKMGGRLLQVSGMRVTYNTQIRGSRVISLDVWDENEAKYLPIDRLRLYKFATDSYLCGVYEPYPSLLGANLVVEGEEAGVIDDLLHQNILSEYLTQLDSPYENSIQGRLHNETNTTAVLNLIQLEEDCHDGTFWEEAKLTCMPCPNVSNVAFSDKKVTLDVENGAMDSMHGRVVLINRELFPVQVAPKSLPSWAQLTRVSGLNATQKASSDYSASGFLVILASGASLAVEYSINASGLAEGTAQGTISFTVLDDRETLRSCVGRDAAFDLLVRISPRPEYNYLGWIRSLGMALMGIVVMTSTALALWVFMHRKLRIVTTLQPSNVMAICAGVLVISTTIIPISVDDSSFSVRSCDVACMATPWILSMGLTVAFSALFSKLWRINKVFGNSRQMRRVRVTHRVFFVSFAILFTLNFSLILTWTFVDPLQWKRLPVESEKWNSYGSCKGTGTASKVIVSLVVLVNTAALLLACFEAYKARNHSDEFSESKYLGVALYSWLQLTLVGCPILFLIDDGNPTAKYFLHCSLLFVVCMSMLMLIFAPILKKLCNRNDSNHTSDQANIHVSGLNISSVPTSNNPLSTLSQYSGKGAIVASIRTAKLNEREDNTIRHSALRESQELGVKFTGTMHSSTTTQIAHV
uniref:G-protein coupled receptors family 3 profile domain-containing protein n=1 Tax=Odontella aurita TaxID=265563 RepID=A0A7S4JBK6_9STRA|mmetsp:Transcript_43242/g.131639  ORF Transcript_43242/g.131639 Transcript_43242/m.131639 type:complete len:1084 (+) Transcript_43242:454-3705(+)|eukprot:CAMPEP_0113547688 /NCGR_PEP_ID=MMETSP0015_2-20120614/12491_1 /TAXON_ID=2838 /ORGANISM="Odontella" /LENGTH=1083 /DNA_ID=CAMNT_0000448263 /DNA_START=376 /DNA_END=3627 /DNA_ORIENTATION=- /assembly_acc=CAM_ASM_000160